MSKLKEKYEKIVDGMHWNALIISFNSQKPENFDIFQNIHFYNGIVELLHKKKGLTFEEFKDAVRKEAMYAFWSKCEYEVIVSPWPPGKTYFAELNNCGLTVKPQYFSPTKIPVEFELRNRGLLEDNKMQTGKYYLQHVDDRHAYKIDVYEQLKPNLDQLTDYIIRKAKYKVAKEIAKQE